jgi:hypothetical protein
LDLIQLPHCFAIGPGKGVSLVATNAGTKTALVPRERYLGRHPFGPNIMENRAQSFDYLTSGFKSVIRSVNRGDTRSVGIDYRNFSANVFDVAINHAVGGFLRALAKAVKQLIA